LQYPKPQVIIPQGVNIITFSKNCVTPLTAELLRFASCRFSEFSAYYLFLWRKWNFEDNGLNLRKAGSGSLLVKPGTRMIPKIWDGRLFLRLWNILID